ncbi:MAG: hypothetical protein RRY29_03880 [Desulfovibrionaceae bacterium]
MSDTVQGTRPISATNSPFNAMAYMVETAIRGQVNTAIPVRVDSVEPGGRGPVGYLSATPLITQMDGQGNALPQRSLPRMPYMRLQGGKCAVIIDPEPGDIGIAVFAQQDISTIGTGASGPSQPGSFRAFDMADGMYIGGIINKEPETWLELTQKGEITLHAPKKITLEAPEVLIRSNSIILDAPNTTVTGNLTTTGKKGNQVDISGNMSMRGNITQEGSHSSTGDQVASGISQTGHTHTGVQPGGGNTGGPNG